MLIQLIKVSNKTQVVEFFGYDEIFLLSGVAILAILIIAAIFTYPKIFKRNTLENLSAKEKISVAVMPLQNMTNDNTLNHLHEVIQDNLIKLLSDYPEELIVRKVESINSLIQSKGLTNYASITPYYCKFNLTEIKCKCLSTLSTFILISLSFIF